MEKRKYEVADFTRSSLEETFARERGNVFSLWSPSELELLGKIGPLTVKHVNDFTKLNLPYDESVLVEHAQVLACFLTNTIDNSVFSGIASVGMVQSKVKRLARIYEILGEECPIRVEDVNDGNLLDIVFGIKNTVFNFASRFRSEFPSVPMESTGSRPFVDNLVQLFGGSIDNIILYGSSAHGEGDDYDLIVVTDEFNRDLYQRIAGKKKSFRSDKDVGFVIMPRTHLPAYSAVDDNSYIVSREGVVIYGKPIELPQMPESENVQKTYFKIAHDLSTLRGALMSEEGVLSMSNIKKKRDDTLKKEIWVNRGLLQMELGRYVSKSESMELEGFKMPELPKVISPETMWTNLFDANYRVKERIKTHLERMAEKAKLN